MDDSYLVIARRYRPQTFADVIGQDAIIRTLKNALQSGRVSHAYLFAGSRGTGKTSIARLYAKALNCSALLPNGEPCNSCSSCVEITEGRSLDVQEIDGASHRGIDHIRSLTESASYAPACGRYKIYLIDEVHMLTKEAFNALLKTLEEPPPSVKFFLATTEPHKIPTTIISRCQRFNLKRQPKEAIATKLRRIVDDMNVRAEEAALLRLAGYADGGFRDAESLLDQVITFSDGHIRVEIIEEVLGIAPEAWFVELDSAIAIADIAVAYTISDRVFHEGKDISHFIDDLTDHYRSLLMLKLRLPQQTTAKDAETESAFLKTASSLSQEHLIEILNLLADAQKTLKTAASQRFLLEWLLLNIVRIRRKVPLALIARKLFELQESIKGEPSSPSPITQNRETPKESPSPSREVAQKPFAPPPPVAPQACEAKTLTHPPVAPKTPIVAPASAIALEIPSPASTNEPSPPKERKVKKEGGNTPNATAEEQTSQPLKRREKGLSKAPAASLPDLPPEQEKARQENLIQFTAAELGATVVRTSKTS